MNVTIKVVKALVVCKVQQVPYFLELQRSHKQAVAAGKGDLPGGKVEEHEALQAALVREIKEETSIDVVNMYELADHQWQHKDRVYQEYVYYVPVVAQFVITISEEHDSYRWVPLDQLSSSTLHPNTIHIIERKKELLHTLIITV